MRKATGATVLVAVKAIGFCATVALTKRLGVGLTVMRLILPAD